jgi:hypothetical protein
MFLPSIDLFITKLTFLRYIFSRIELHYPKRTGLSFFSIDIEHLYKRKYLQGQFIVSVEKVTEKQICKNLF